MNNSANNIKQIKNAKRGGYTPRFAKDVNKHAGLKTNIREYFARTKVFIDSFFNVQPKFLGEKIEIV